MKELLLIFAVFCITSQARALDHWYVPTNQGIKTIKITNPQSQPLDLWISNAAQDLETYFEVVYQIPAYGTEEIPLNELPPLGTSPSWIHLKAPDSSRFMIQALTKFENWFLIPLGSAVRWKGKIRNGSTLILNNLSPQETSVQNHRGDQYIIPAFSSLQVPVQTSTENWTLTGKNRFSALFLSPLGSKALTPDETPFVWQEYAPPVGQQSSYFQLTHPSGKQSFTVEITDPQLIAQARAQIGGNKQFIPTILIAEIDLGHNFANRNLSESRKTPWSWHVSKVIRFASMASQECDGSPEMLEEMILPWKTNLGVICFWSYRITKELTYKDLSLQPLQP